MGKRKTSRVSRSWSVSQGATHVVSTKNNLLARELGYGVAFGMGTAYK